MKGERLECTTLVDQGSHRFGSEESGKDAHTFVDELTMTPLGERTVVEVVTIGVDERTRMHGKTVVRSRSDLLSNHADPPARRTG
jgi:hypothetical protein